MKAKPGSVLFICSPSLGIVDSWLPTIYKIKEKAPDCKIVFAVPQERILYDMDPENVLIRISEKVLDSVVFQSSTGFWGKTETLKEARDRVEKDLIEKKLEEYIQRIEGRPAFRLFESFFRNCLKLKFRFSRREIAFSWAKPDYDIKVILYDIYAEKKEGVHEIVEYFRKRVKFSLNHGLKLKNINYFEGNQPELREDVISYMQNSVEADHERDRFGIPYANQRVVGVPRHEKEWIDILIREEGIEPDEIWHDFILLISRPHTTDYHPPERKRFALENVKRLAWEVLDKRVVVKLHPKESDQRIFEEVFGTESYGSSWVFSNKHPLILGNRCDFAIALFSGVVIDMIALGVPPIELLDLRGLPAYDNGSALRDEKGNPAFDLRFNGLTLGASSYEELLEQVKKIQNQRSAVISDLKEKYSRYYKTEDGINDKMADEIISYLN